MIALKTTVAAILILLAAAVQAPAQDARIEVLCPAMPVAKLGLGLWECSKEVGTGTASFRDGKVITFTDFVIDPTLVRRRVVDPCVQFGYSDRMDQLWLSLPAEPVVLRRSGLLKFTPVATAMLAIGLLTLHDGTEYDVRVVYPDCPAIRVTSKLRVAQAIVATGVAVKR